VKAFNSVGDSDYAPNGFIHFTDPKAPTNIILMELGIQI